jgi:beta-lactamase regulating signal transducer with metallopeptidase domain
MTLTDALGWTLLHTVWEGAAAALLLAVALACTRSSRARYLLACAALTASLTGFAITLIHFLPAGAFISTNAPILRAVPSGAGAGSFPFATAVASREALPQWLAIFWIAGIVVFQVRAWGGWLTISRMRKTGICAAPAPWRERLKHLAHQLRVTRPVVLLESSLTDVPVVIGHLKPVILIPVGLLAGLPNDQVETILLHELAHILRYDYVVNLLQTMTESLLFYHPATWWISSVIRGERENCCDDLVVAATGDAHRPHASTHRQPHRDPLRHGPQPRTCRSANTGPGSAIVLRKVAH